MSDDLRKAVTHILKDIKVELGDEFGRNFERQGFFSQKWQRRKSPLRGNGHILLASGQLRKSIHSRITDQSITFYSSLPYAGIHNEGGEIKVTPRMKRFFWRKYYEAQGSIEHKKNGSIRNNKRNRQLTTNAEYWRSLALMREGTTIKMPRRQFIGMSPEVEKSVRQIIEKELAVYFSQDFLRPHP